MGIADLLKRGLVVGPYWTDNRDGTGEPTHVAVFYSWASATNRSLDALCVGESASAAAAAATKALAKLDKLTALITDDAKQPEVVDKGMKLYILARDGSDPDVAVYDLDAYNGDETLPKPMGTGNPVSIIARALSTLAE